MANVSKHPLFDAHLHEIELNHPELRAEETVNAVKWAFEHGEMFEDVEEELGEVELGRDETELVYFIKVGGIQIFYEKRDPVGRPTEIFFRTVHLSG
jgi:hypothetical protein